MFLLICEYELRYYCGPKVVKRLPGLEMGKFMKPGILVMVLAGCYAARQAVIVKNIDDGASYPPYNYALVSGID
ncbi:hypothetical protein COCON_G00032910 [Conger conger]|uniref:Uncharacterized protein n=1 Tax=Conger conger TaxID=82655 RepID=A0A9Q1DZ01_CONCO|nr:hypothetical protein COCON_G00032910 [Conger conger]